MAGDEDLAMIRGVRRPGLVYTVESTKSLNMQVGGKKKNFPL